MDVSGVPPSNVHIQDVGTRFYTYITTLKYVLEAAAKANSPVIVQLSSGGAQFFAGKSINNDNNNAQILGGIAGSTLLRLDGA